MKDAFLKQVGSYLLDKHAGEISHLTVLVPTKRSAFFLKREIGNLVDTPIISPAVFAIEDIVERVSGLQTLQPVDLLFELYTAFQSVDATIEFDRFMGWASVLLNDFDRIDMALIDADYLFDYLTEAKALERWDLIGKEAPKGTKQYFALFANIKKVYHVFRERLMAEGKAYPGMAFRYVAENIATLDQGDPFIYFVGFNAFTASEKKIIQYFIKAKRAEVLWDSDNYYLRENKLLEAGKTFREYKGKGLFGTEWKWAENNLLEREVDVYIYGVPSATLQTKVAGELYSLMLSEGKEDEDTAIVLTDENLLVPVMNALDDNVKDYNITMGLPLKSSLLFTLVEGVFELHLNTYQGENEPVARYSHRYINKLFNHPFIRFYDRSDEGKGAYRRLLHEMTVQNKVYLSQEELRSLMGVDTLSEVLFEPWAFRDVKQILRTFYRIIDALRIVYREHKHAIETEYLFLFYTLLQQLELSIEQQAEELSALTLRQLLFEMIRQTKVPFSGEPVSNLQIIGMLETRTLDFDRVIMLSLNEGVFPKKKIQNSLIPYDIALEVGLPTHEHQESLASYYFYRLLQRSKEVHLMYVNTHDGMGGGERSRFIQQLEYEWTQYNPNVRLHYRDVMLESEQSTDEPASLEKDEVVLQNIVHYLTHKGIYPTHVQTLLESPLTFYMRHVLGIAEEREADETLGMDKIGTWLHDAFEQLDNEFFLQKLEPTKEDIERILTDRFEELFVGYVTDTGINKVYLEIGKTQFLAFLEAQHLKEGHAWPIATEQSLRVSFPVQWREQTLQVVVGGKIDRVELSADKEIRVMDYKTGSVDLPSVRAINKDPETREEKLLTGTSFKLNYVRQLWFYQYLVYRNMTAPTGWELNGKTYNTSDYVVKSAFYSLRNPAKPIMNPLDLGVTNSPEEFIEETERMLTRLVLDLLNPEVPLV